MPLEKRQYFKITLRVYEHLHQQLWTACSKIEQTFIEVQQTFMTLQSWAYGTFIASFNFTFMHFHLQAVADKATHTATSGITFQLQHTLLLLGIKHSLEHIAVRSQFLATMVKLENLLLIIVLQGNNSLSRTVISPNSSIEQTRVC